MSVRLFAPLLTIVLLASAVPAFAQRGTTTIEGPGFKMERRNGWFGTQQNVYSDVLGNRVEQKQGWFGRRSTNSSVLGNQVHRDNRGTTVTDNSGNVVYKRRRGWFGGEDTTINTNGVFNRMKGLFGGTNNTSPTYANPGY